MRYCPFLIKPCLLTLVIFLGSCEPSPSNTGWQLDVFDPALNETRVIKQDDIARKLILLNYWAEWCKPCIEEMPELNRFAAIHQGKVLVLSVNFDNKQDAALQAAMQKVGITFPAITSNPAKVFLLPEISGLPATLILDEHGVLKEQLLGPQTLSSLETALSKL